MTLRTRLLIYAAGGIVVGLLVRAFNGWIWDMPSSTVTGNVIYHLGFFLPFVGVALLAGYLRRKRPQNPS